VMQLNLYMADILDYLFTAYVYLYLSIFCVRLYDIHFHKYGVDRPQTVSTAYTTQH